MMHTFVLESYFAESKSFWCKDLVCKLLSAKIIEYAHIYAPKALVSICWDSALAHGPNCSLHIFSLRSFKALVELLLFISKPDSYASTAGLESLANGHDEASGPVRSVSQHPTLEESMKRSERMALSTLTLCKYWLCSTYRKHIWVTSCL